MKKMIMVADKDIERAKQILELAGISFSITTDSPKAETPAVAPTETPAEKPKKQVYTLGSDGKSVTINSLPKAVWWAVYFSLRDNEDATFNRETKVWTFKSKKACKVWTDDQDARQK